MSYVNAETMLVQYFDAGQGRLDELKPMKAELRELRYSTDVPVTRPERFVTFERVGGGSDQFQDHPQIAVQVWAESRTEAERLCNLVKGEMTEGFRYHPQVSTLEIGNQTNFPDLDSGHARFQMLTTFSTSAY